MFKQIRNAIPDRLKPEKWRGGGPVIIPVVRMTGAIAAGGSRLNPTLSLASVAGPLEKAFSIKAAPAVAIVINSPGGSAAQSRLIYKRIRDLAAEKNKRVLVFVEDAAASGGYMIACAGDEIIADPCSVVGSIGVVAATFGLQDAIARIGVERRVYTAGTNKVTLDPFQGEKPEDVAYLKSVLDDLHGVFIALVKEGRGARLKDDPDVFSGRYWIAEKALALGLIDGIGDLRSSLKARFGEKAEARLIGAPRGLFARLGFGSRLSLADIGSGTVDALAARVEEDALWARIGLTGPR
ncbi:MAG: S49 family peptidase [Rhizobiaceae bacterium]|jgi:signal peptide peptidase SppA|nr:S49 family peptidase [Rhizobiaceae bacterium]